MVRKIYSGCDAESVETGAYGYAANTVFGVRQKFEENGYKSLRELCQLMRVDGDGCERRFVCAGDDDAFVVSYSYFMPVVSKKNVATFKKHINENRTAWCITMGDGVDWLNDDVHIAETPETRHAAFTNYTELHEAAMEHNKGRAFQSTEVWLKDRITGDRYMVAGVCGTILTSVLIGGMHRTLEELLSGYTFLDDTPVGKPKEKEK